MNSQPSPVGPVLIGHQREIRELHDPPAVAHGVKHGLVGPRVAWMLLDHLTALDQRKPYHLRSHRCLAGLEIEEILPPRAAAAEDFNDLPQPLCRQRPFLQRLNTCLKLLYRRPAPYRFS